ncbi:MAG TPA: threonine/serine dehydratase [Candidatus Limnocylindrales bacterium]|nr:threonine/serine dehydratase [Candidatus Limnocylindrales bacterium]
MKTAGLTLDAIRAARATVMGAAIRTPLVRLNLWDAPADVYLKLENLQPIGSFKIRGAANAIAQMEERALRDGVLTASAGNMAQGVAWNARRLGIPCTVIAPDTAPEAKVRAVERLGGRVIKVPFDRWWQTFTDRAYPGIAGAFVHPFDDDRVMAGNGTIGLEILEDLEDVDSVLIPWGGGGLACGIASAIKGLKPAVRVYAVEVETATPLRASLQVGAVQTVPYTPSFVDGIGSRTVFPDMLALAQDLLDGSQVASLEETKGAIRLLAERNRVIAEGAGAVALAVALSGRAGAGKIVCVVSGGNIDLDKLAGILAEGSPSPVRGG